MNLRAKFLRWRYERELDRQAPLAAEIFEKIIKRVDPKQILASIKRPISKEIKNILVALYYIPQLSPIKQATVSVIIPHFNQQKYLPETLHALCNQSYVPEEVIVVDDQSDRFDEVQTILKRWQDKLHIVLLKPATKLYTGKAREYGARAASGNIIIMNDADDISHQNRIELVRRVFLEYPRALHVNTGCVAFKDYSGYIKSFTWLEAKSRSLDTKKISERMKKIFTGQYFTIQEKEFRVRRGSYGAAGAFGVHDGNVAFRPEVFDQIHYSEFGKHIFTKWVDYEFNMILYLAGMCSYQIDLPLIYYRQDSSSFISFFP